MRISLGRLRALIKEQLVNEIGGLSGSIRRVRDGKRQQFKIGKVEDQNREISAIEADSLFPGATDAWTEIVPEFFPDFPFADDPIVVRRRSAFFKEGDKLTVAAKDMPQITLATWLPTREDWILAGDEV